jgi:DNA-directed RNA polymerases I, II, and III subunit RPABC1
MDSVDPKTVALLFNIKKNQLKMVMRRGYNIDKEVGILKMNEQQFGTTYINFATSQNKSFRDALTYVYENDEGKRLLVYYADAGDDTVKLGISEIAPVIAQMKSFGALDSVVISSKALSPAANKHIQGLLSYNIQVFDEMEMAYDPTEHFLVPKHIPLTRVEAQKFLADNNILIDELPNILADDVMAKYYGLRQGDIVRIERENMFETSIIRSVTYKAIKG